MSQTGQSGPFPPFRTRVLDTKFLWLDFAVEGMPEHLFS